MIRFVVTSFCLIAGSLLQVDLIAAEGRSNADSIVVPFEAEGTKIFVPIQINHHDCSFVLDTGSRGTVLSRFRAQQLGLNLSDERTVQSGAGNGAAIRVAEAETVTVGFAGINRMFGRIPVVDLQQVSEGVGRRIDGLLGADLLSKYVVEIDYRQNRIELHSPTNFVYRGPGREFEIQLDRGWVTTSATTAVNGTEFNGRYVIDTGAASPVYFSSPTVARHRLVKNPESSVRGVLSVGAGGESKGIIGTVDRMQIGPFQINQPIAVFSLDRAGFLAGNEYDGIIGAGILARCRVFFLYEQSRMILEPTGTDTPNSFDASGVVFRATGPEFRKYEILSVLIGSPAETAGLLRGDQIVQVDSEPVAEFTATTLRERLKEAGRPVSLTIRRGSHLSRHILQLTDYAREGVQ